MIYSLPYVIFVIALCMLSFQYEKVKDDKSRCNILACTIGLFIFFIGFRGFIMSDWIGYYPFFTKCSTYDLTENVVFEPGFVLLTLVCKSIFDDYTFYTVFIHLIDLTLLVLFLRKRVDNIPLALLLCFVFDGLALFVNLYRNFIAILIFLNALEFIEKRKPVQYFLCCLLALSFHMSSIIFFPMYFFFNRLPNRWVYLGAFIAFNIVFLFKISLVLPIISLLGLGELFEVKVKAYTEVFTASSALSIGYLERLMTGSLIFLYYDKLKEVRENNAVIINGILCYFFLYFCFSEFDVLSKRFSYLFVYGYWIIWCDLVKCFYFENNRILFKTFIYVYCVFRISGTAFLPDFKYENVLFGSQSYQERLYYHNKTYTGD